MAPPARKKRKVENLRDAQTALMAKKRTSNDSSASNDSSIESVPADIKGIYHDIS